MRKYDTQIHFPGCGRKELRLWPSADDSSKQELQNSGSGRGHLSFTPLYHYKVIWAWENLNPYYPCRCQQRSKPSTMIGTEEGTEKKKSQHVVNFQTAETS